MLRRTFFSSMRYNRWAHNAICDHFIRHHVSQSDLEAIRPYLPFGSVLATLSHMWLAENIWLTRVNPSHKLVIVTHTRVPGQPPPGTARLDMMPGSSAGLARYWMPGVNPADFSAPFGNCIHSIKASLLHSCGVWLDVIEAMSDSDIASSVVSYQDTTTRENKSLPLRAVLSHVVLHGQHHRGQVSTVAQALGIGYPVLDLSYAINSVPALRADFTDPPSAGGPRSK